MENQHRKITGYRELSQEEIDLINRIKAVGEEVNQLILDINKHLITQNYVIGTEEYARCVLAKPYIWLEKGTQDIQVGLMEITRSVAQPTSF